MTSAERFSKTIFGGGARSTLGYTVRFNSRSSVQYDDPGRTIFVSAEGLVGRKAMALYPSYMTMGSRRGDQVVDEELRKLVTERVRSAARFLGWEIE